MIWRAAGLAEKETAGQSVWTGWTICPTEL